MHIKIKAQCAYSNLKHIVVSPIFNFLPLFTQSVRLCAIQADGDSFEGFPKQCYASYQRGSCVVVACLFSLIVFQKKTWSKPGSMDQGWLVLHGAISWWAWAGRAACLVPLSARHRMCLDHTHTLTHTSTEELAVRSHQLWLRINGCHLCKNTSALTLLVSPGNAEHSGNKSMRPCLASLLDRVFVCVCVRVGVCVCVVTHNSVHICVCAHICSV